jgi:hypothetical protein
MRAAAEVAALLAGGGRESATALPQPLQVQLQPPPPAPPAASSPSPASAFDGIVRPLPLALSVEIPFLRPTALVVELPFLFSGVGDGGGRGYASRRDHDGVSDTGW